MKTPPPEVFAAARLISKWAAENNVSEFAIDGIQQRTWKKQMTAPATHQEAMRDMRDENCESDALCVSTLTDFLYDACYQADPVPLVPQIHGVTVEDFEQNSVPDLLALACDAGQPSRTRLAALDAILARIPGVIQ